jgi:hypothetical protein
MVQNLTPEDIQLMKNAIAEYEGSAGTSSPATSQNSTADAVQDRQMLEAIAAALGTVIDAVESLQKSYDDLEHLVNDEIIGGVQKLYQENVRMDGIAGIKAKYGEQLSPYEGVFQALVDDPNADIYSKLYDKLEELKSGADYNPDTEDSYVTSLLDKLKASAPAPAVAVEISKTEAAPASEDDALVTKLRAMKQKAGSAGSY